MFYRELKYIGSLPYLVKMTDNLNLEQCVSAGMDQEYFVLVNESAKCDIWKPTELGLWVVSKY